MSALQNTLARETGKIIRQEAALASTRALIVLLEKEIALEYSEQQEEMKLKVDQKAIDEKTPKK